MADTPNAGGTSATAAQNTYQYGRTCTLLVSNKQGQALDLSQLHIKFAVKKSGIMTPNVASIRVYNLDESTALLIKQEFTKVILQAGYSGNFGVIFKGNIKQASLGRESATETFIDLNCGDGEQAYNFAILNTTIRKGSSPSDHLNASLSALAGQGVGSGYVAGLPQTKQSRGKVFYGNARDYTRSLADSIGATWSIQDENVIFLPQGAYLPNQAVVISSKTGMIGAPQQTIEGIMAKMLLNPKLKIHGRVQIDEKSVQKFQLNFSVPGSPANTPVPLTYDGVYYILVAEHSGDTRAPEWYTALTTLNIDPSSNPLNSVQVGFGS